MEWRNNEVRRLEVEGGRLEIPPPEFGIKAKQTRIARIDTDNSALPGLGIKAKATEDRRLTKPLPSAWRVHYSSLYEKVFSRPRAAPCVGRRASGGAG